MSKNFSNTERTIKALLETKDSFVYQGNTYHTKFVGKPSPPKGECKTDIYVLAETEDYELKEFKISIKQPNADFIGNKLSLGRAIEIFGPQAQDIIFEHAQSIREQFEGSTLVFFDKRYKTSAKSMTLGWKFEIMNKTSGNKSDKLNLTHQQKVEIYSGQNLQKRKRNSIVNGIPVIDSGIANFMLVVEPTVEQELDYYMNELIPVEEYVADKELYFACKALNYRATPDKWDGDRPLCVYINWQLHLDELSASFVYTNPLETKGNELGENLQEILQKLGINKNNFSQLEQYLSEDISIYKAEK